MALDKRLLDSAMELISNSHPNDVHLQELYDYIEENLELSSKQLSLHKQVLGQIEPNWKHDLRNLLGTAKTNSLLINPIKNYWGLPRRPVGIEFDSDICFDKMLKRASKACNKNEQFECKRSGETLSVSTYSDENISIENSSYKKKNLLKSMVISKINHLLNCGGKLPIGSLHRWANIESAIVFLCDQIEYDDSDIVFV
jgi:hypothetical protein